MAENPDVHDALNALEAMCAQYLSAPDDGVEYDHLAMAAGEEACDVLCRLRPDRWQRAVRGMRYVGPEDVWVRPARSAEP
jgi:hypothetical protein